MVPLKKKKKKKKKKTLFTTICCVTLLLFALFLVHKVSITEVKCTDSSVSTSSPPRRLIIS